MLGARGNISGSANFDDYVENGYYGVSRSNSYSNSPTTSFAGTLIVFNTKDTNYTNALSQYAYNIDLGEMYYRMKWAGTWQSWIRIDNFGCSTPADLASLLGVSNFIIGWQGTPLNSSVFAFTFGSTYGSSIILDIQLYDVTGVSSYITISHTKWNTDSWIGLGKNNLLTVKKKGDVMYISESGGDGYGFVKFRYQGDMSVSLQKVSEIPSDATDVAFY